MLALPETSYIHTMMMHIISYRDRRGGEESASERVEFVARRADNGAKFGCVDPDRVGESSEELELRVLCEYIVGDDAGGRESERDLTARLKGVPKV